MRTDPLRPARSDERGFVLGVVLFALVALTLSVSGAFVIAQSEGETAAGQREEARAFHLAQAGLSLFMNRRGLPPDSVVYQLGGGRVVVRAALIAWTSPHVAVYEIRSQAEVSTPRNRTLPTRRTVRQLARLDRQGVKPVAGVATTARGFYLMNDYINGTDNSSSGSCPSAVRGDAGGVLVGSAGPHSWNSGIWGSPRFVFESDAAAIQARLGVRWNELTDSTQTFQYELPSGSWPNFGSLPWYDYPAIRVQGDFVASSTRSGRGVLIVTGDLTFGDGFAWDGIILAGDLPPTTADIDIRGMIASGFKPGARTLLDLRDRVDIRYDSCKVWRANAAIARWRPLPNTWVEQTAF